MNDVLDFLGAVRQVANIYLWLVFGAATLLLVADLTQDRKARVDREDAREQRAA